MSARQRHLPLLRLDFRSGLPVYLQIIQQVRRHAAGGRLRPGDQLPTVREMAVHLGVNFNTVARAYRLLDDAGVVSAQQGRGTYVLKKGTAKQTGSMTLQALAAQYIAEAKRQRFSEAQIVAMVTRRLKLGIDVRRAGDNDG
jgi:GntR family transcriptional regulator